MAEVPDYVVDPAAKAARNFFLAVGGVSGFVSFAAFSNGGNGLFAALVAGGAIYIASKIRVRRPLKGGLY